MIRNLSEYFKPELEIFLDTVSYKRIENVNDKCEQELSLLCQDNLKAMLSEDGVRIIVTRTLMFEPEALFALNVSFGADLKFNERKVEHEWTEINLAEEFGENFTTYRTDYLFIWTATAYFAFNDCKKGKNRISVHSRSGTIREK